MSRRRRVAVLTGTITLAVSLAWSAPARADVVDEAFTRGTTAAEAGRWEDAAAALEEAEDLLPGRSAALSYNLGTAYAQLGRYGPATFHLRRALQPEARPTAALADAAQRNLGIVQRRAEVASTASGARMGRPDAAWGPVRAAVRGRVVGWLSLLFGWLGLALWTIARWRQRRGGSEPHAGGAAPGANVVGSLVIVLMALFVVLGTAHGLAVRAEQNAPPAIVLDDQVAVRDAPGVHRKQIFTVQGGSQVRVVDRTRDWCQIRMDDGLEGWVPEIALGHLAGAGTRRIARARALTSEPAKAP